MIANTPSVATANFEINLQPTNKQVVAGEKIELNVNAVGNQTATYQWYQNNNRINGATTKTLTLSNVSEGQSGIYFAEVRSGTQLLNSQRVYVKVAVRYCY